MAGPLPRRDFLKLAAKAPLGVAAARVLAACGKPASSTGPEAAPSKLASPGKPIKIGFIALTDCASVVMASKLGYFAERGLDVSVVKQASWPATRDNLLNGEIDAAHCLFSMPLSLAAGIGGRPDQTLQVAMVLSSNGQSITLKKELAAAGFGDLQAARAALSGLRGAKMAMTFPGGTHDIWLRYWLKAAGVLPGAVGIIPIPPPQMVANMKVGNMDGFCVGEPWNAQAVKDGIGFTAINSQDIWDNHSEKALVVNPAFASTRRPELKAVMGAILKASKWLDEPANRKEAAQTLGVPNFVGAAPEVIEGRMLGQYDLGGGHGQKTYTDDYMRFYRGGAVNLPRHSHAIWFLAQYQRLGLIKAAPDYGAIAGRILLADLYKEVARAEKVPVPSDDMAPFHVKLDGADFDPRHPEAEAARA